MPFTPYHLGPGVLLGVGARRWIHIPAIVVGSVIVDLEPFAVLVFNLNKSLHGFFHTLLGGGILALALTIIIYVVRKPISRLMTRLKLEQKQGFWFILASAMLGMTSHIVIDSIFHPNIYLFYPFTYSPFHGLVSRGIILAFCTISLLIALVLYAVRIIIEARNEPSPVK